MCSDRPPHMAEQMQDDQLEHTPGSSYVRIRDVALKTCQRRWTIGKSGERESGISVLAARHDAADDDANVNCLKLNCFDIETSYLFITDFFEIEPFICNEMDVELNNLQWLMHHETKPRQTKPNIWLVFRSDV